MKYLLALLTLVLPLIASGDEPDYALKPEDPEYAQMVGEQPPKDSNVHPDCSETPVKFDDLKKMAGESNDQMSFLRALPKNSFQTFTLVMKSQSPEAPCISEKYPGVLRMSITGETVIRYTCDPKCALYNQAQILHFDPAARKWESVDVNFKHPPQDRMNLNSKSCVSCHSPKKGSDDIRPNWSEYPNWAGFMGTRDDDLSYGDDAKFSAFRKRVRSGELSQNPCYTELPWYKGADSNYKDYPYSNLFKVNNYDLRPNLRFTEVLSHRMGQRLARKFEEHPLYKEMKYKVLQAALDCKNVDTPLPTDPALIADKAKADTVVPRTELTRIAPQFGLSNGDFTMFFDSPKSTEYQSAIAPQFDGRNTDVDISEIALGQMLKDLAHGDQEFQPFVKLSRGETRHFGERFSCIDDLGGSVVLNQKGLHDLCAKLAAKDAQNKTVFPDCNKPGQPMPVQTVKGLASVAGELKKQDPNIIHKGHALVNTVCATCHGAKSERNLKSDLRFFKNEKATKDSVCNSSLDAQASQRMNDSAEPMPPYDSKFSLTQSQIESVSAYLGSLRGKCK